MSAMNDGDDLLAIVQEALQDAWNDFCSDTGCHPDCFERRGGKLYADFARGNFARSVSDLIRARWDGAGCLCVVETAWDCPIHGDRVTPLSFLAPKEAQ